MITIEQITELVKKLKQIEDTSKKLNDEHTQVKTELQTLLEKLAAPFKQKPKKS